MIATFNLKVLKKFRAKVVTAVERTPYDQEQVGLNPAKWWTLLFFSP